MPSDININIDNDNIIEFLNYIDNDTKGDIGYKYINFIRTINNLANNGSYEINQYTNFINSTNKQYPNLSKLNDLINSAKSVEPINFHHKFCVYLWYWIYN